MSIEKKHTGTSPKLVGVFCFASRPLSDCGDKPTPMDSPRRHSLGPSIQQYPKRFGPIWASGLDLGVEPKIWGKPPKSSILIGFSIIFNHFGVPPLFLETPILCQRIVMVSSSYDVRTQISP